jgi:hypothetical protein
MRTSGQQAPLFVGKWKGDGFYVMGRGAPGVYIEPATDGEQTPIICDDLTDGGILQDAYAACGRTSNWTRVGLECGREYEKISINAYAEDTFVLTNSATWRTTPFPGARLWAIEFSDGKLPFRRRLFYCTARHRP